MGNYDEIKEECYQANLLLPKLKLIDLTFGNVSVAEPGRRVFAIKPSGVDYKFENIDPTQVCAVLVHSHGPFVWGPSGKKAVENALALEIIAEMALKALQLNPHAQPVSTPLLNKHFLRKHGINAYYGQKP